ncbi:gas vesicle protein GvpM [Halomarina pelagica]|uniref:gas vesicle protein GvpM n=1 Tax=Halomarina pelagica TaxID=2961599 RepID=UPI0020C4A466|nr:gas vesicle protein [Halomarina sp. BND7]
MEPRRDDALVDLLDVLLRDGAVLQADVIISVADVPLVGLKLRAALAGMETMAEHGMFVEWDERIRERALEREEAERSETRELNADADVTDDPRPELDG